MNLPDFLFLTENGEIRLKGHRIDLYHLVILVNEGQTAEMLHHEYPSLSFDLIRQAMDFYQEHKAEVDAYVAKLDAKIEKVRASSAPGPTLADLKARRQALDSARTS